MLLLLLGAMGVPHVAGAQTTFAPLSVEISAEHPLLLFQVSGVAGEEPIVYAQRIADAWLTLPDSLRGYSVLQIDTGDDGALDRHARYMTLLALLQEAGVPLVVRVADEGRLYPLDQLETLLRDFAIIRGFEASGLQFNEYAPPSSGGLGQPENVAWLSGAVELAARQGRFLHVSLDEVHWARIMSNLSAGPLVAKLSAFSDYIIPSSLQRGAHTVTQNSALMGLWLEGVVGQWGIAADARWYSDAGFVSPGVFGVGQGNGSVPSSVYRAMILNGAMTGASVYSFSPDAMLWFGAARHHWDEAIYPTLTEILGRSYIARKQFIQKLVPVAYQLAPAVTPLDFHLNLRDIDGVLDEGFLVKGAYGMERPGQMPELILNRSNHFWVPILSAHAQQETLDMFSAVVQPGTMDSAAAWTVLLEEHLITENLSEAFVARVGRGIFIMNTRENVVEAQTFTIADTPAPVRRFSARRENDRVVLSWGMREGDVSYKVYKRVFPETDFRLLAEGIESGRFLDEGVAADETTAYSVTALTNETEPHEGIVTYGEYRVVSAVESRIDEEATIGPLLMYAESTPVVIPRVETETKDWWRNFDGVDITEVAHARAILARIEGWDLKLQAQDLAGVLEVYAADYTDAQGWQLEYVRRAYQWFFERYRMHRMHRQIRRWDFSSFGETGQVNVLLYCRLTGTALSDVAGRRADLPISIPRTKTAEVWTSWALDAGVWRMTGTNPALPNFKDLLSFSAGPYDGVVPSADGVE